VEKWLREAGRSDWKKLGEVTVRNGEEKLGEVNGRSWEKCGRS
jgi:hypothetical protein